MVRNRLSAGAAAAAVTFALLAGAAALGRLNFARWDNVETFLPAIWYAHNELLQGRIALWNPLQQLGEPLHALGIGGVLYLPYTLAVLLTRSAPWPEAATLDISAVLHAALGAWGLAALAGELGVRRSIAWAAGVSGMLSGFAMAVGSMWVHVIPNLAWSVWAMWGVRRVVLNERPGAGAAVAAVSLGLVFHTGHAQSGANVWLATLLWTVALAIAARRWPWRRLALMGLAGVLIALPAILPTALIFPDADRVHEQLAASHGFSARAILLGSLWPGFPGDDRALVHTVLITPFIAVWLLPALILGLLLVGRSSDEQRILARAFIATLAVGLIFVWLNIGAKAGLYSLLHSLPIWSKFRMAFKYWERAVPLLALAGALGLELAARRRPGVWLRLLVPLTLAGAAASIWIGHSPARSKPYRVDRRADARLDLARSEHRVLPLSPPHPDHAYIRPLSLFYAASLDGYQSATGHRFALTSIRMSHNLAADVAGVPDRRQLPLDQLLRSNWVRLAHVGHLISARDDTAALSAVSRAFPRATFTDTRYARIAHVPPSWPRVYFATEQVPGNAAGIYEVLYTPVSISAVAVEGDDRRRPLPPAAVRRVHWERQSILVGVDAPQGGLLALSLGYSREWRVRVDGARARLAPVNGMFSGVWVPAGARRVELRIRKWPLYAGLLSGLFGIGLALAQAQLKTE